MLPQFFSCRRSATAMPILLALFLIFISGAKQGLAETPTSYGPWNLQCETALNTKKEYCRLVQSTFFDEAQTQRLLQVVIARSGKTQNLGLLLWLPLGISLPMGTFLQVDDGEPLELIVERCERNGCRVETELNADYLRTLQRGGEARVLVHDRSRNLAELSFSLDSLTAAIAALQLKINSAADKF